MDVAAKLKLSVIRGLDPRIHPPSQIALSKNDGSRGARTKGYVVCARQTTMPGNDTSYQDKATGKPPHDAPPSAFQPRDLPLGLFRSQAETRPHDRQRR